MNRSDLIAKMIQDVLQAIMVHKERSCNCCGDNCKQQKCEKACKKSTPFFHHLYFAAALRSFFCFLGLLLYTVFVFFGRLDFTLVFCCLLFCGLFFCWLLSDLLAVCAYLCSPACAEATGRALVEEGRSCAPRTKVSRVASGS